MATKKPLADMLNRESEKPQIRRGQGMRLSTEPVSPEEEQHEQDTQERTNASAQERTNASAQERTNASAQEQTVAPAQKDAPKRVNRGYMLREDLITSCKLIAVKEGRKLYEVMEEALEEYLHKKEETG
jgi:hypothetical protein